MSLLIRIYGESQHVKSQSLSESSVSTLVEVLNLENNLNVAVIGVFLFILKHTTMTFFEVQTFFYYFASLQNQERRKTRQTKNIQGQTTIRVYLIGPCCLSALRRSPISETVVIVFPSEIH